MCSCGVCPCPPHLPYTFFTLPTYPTLPTLSALATTLSTQPSTLLDPHLIIIVSTLPVVSLPPPPHPFLLMLIPVIPPGTYGNVTGFGDPAQCADVQPGFYAPAGSVLPTPCPAWGFCAGRAHDDENLEFPGSQPVRVQGGKKVAQQIESTIVQTTRRVVEHVVELQADDASSVNKTAFRHHMAALHGVPVEAIAVVLTREEQALKEWEDAIEQEGEQDRGRHKKLALQKKLTSHKKLTSQKKLTYGIRIDPKYLTDDVSVESLAATLHSKWDSDSSTSSLASVLGVSVKHQAAFPYAVSVTANRTQTVHRLVQVDCDPGFWGQEGKCIACLPGTHLPPGESECHPCPGGTHQRDFNATQCSSCEAGSVCSPGSSALEPCPRGRFSNQSDLADVTQCERCPPGSACSLESTAPIMCPPGTMAASHEAATCSACNGGSFQPDSGGTACHTCSEGSYCPSAASAALPCAAGRYSASTGLSSADQCTTTQVGHYTSAGSTSETACSPGGFTASDGQGACSSCRAGSYQAASAATACDTCVTGSFCPTASSAAIPCYSGTYSKLLGLTTASECSVCPVGHHCATGSITPTTCSAGSISATNTSATCLKCSAGYFQSREGASACDTCTAGSYCQEGSSTPVPCPGGRYGNGTGLVSDSSCSLVSLGEWAPTGSALPAECPASGFYCPGYILDTVNNPPGSRPIIVDVGSQTTATTATVTEVVREQSVSTNLTVDQDIATFNETAYRIMLGEVYNVSWQLISLSASAASLRLAITIKLPSDSSSSLTLDSLFESVSAVSAAELSTSLGVNVSVTGSPSKLNVTRTIQTQVTSVKQTK